VRFFGGVLFLNCRSLLRKDKDQFEVEMNGLSDRRHTPKEKRCYMKGRFLTVKSSFSTLINPILKTKFFLMPHAHAFEWMN
jgi:hypothetical protein